MKKIPQVIWSPLAIAFMTLMVGLIGWATGQPFLFPALGPTAALQITHPKLKSARLYNVLLTHALAGLCGYGAVFACGAANAPSALSFQLLPFSRVAASVLGIAALELLQTVSRSWHPPAAATLLMITLGGFQADWVSVIALVAGVLILAVIGEPLRRARLRWGDQNEPIPDHDPRT